MASSPPNIVVVMSDDHGQWALGAYGNAEVRTPSLDYMAKTGIRFVNAFTPSPVCSPARASFWTGRIPSQHGVHDFLGEGSEGHDWMRDETTLAQILHDNGYVTGLSGKWHLGNDQSPAIGFDYWYSQYLKTRLPEGSSSPWPEPPVMAFEPQSRSRVVEHVLATESGYDLNAITDRAIHFLRARDGTRPFFLFVGYISTHSFWSHHPEHHVDQFRNCTFGDIPNDTMYPFGRPVVEATFDTRDNPREALAQYYAAVAEVDAGVGRLLDEVEMQGIEDQTLLVYTSDHGCMCGHHGLWGKGNATRPLNMLEESIRVPLIVQQPSAILGNQSRTEPVTHCDLFQTILEASHVGVDGAVLSARNYPGRSFAGTFGGAGLKHWPRHVFGEYGTVRMARSDRFKLVRRYPAGPNELFDLIEDPRETVNKLEDPSFAAVMSELTSLMETWFARYEDRSKSGLLVESLPRHNTEEAWRGLP